MRRLSILACVAAAGAVAVVPTGASADGCGEVVDLGGQAYIDVRAADSGDPSDIWIYAEDNGVEGLQTDPDLDKECPNGHSTPDFLIF